ncbi:MAG: TonB-dependent receptor [Steroidobacteraceae bacterium]
MFDRNALLSQRKGMSLQGLTSTVLLTAGIIVAPLHVHAADTNTASDTQIETDELGRVVVRASSRLEALKDVPKSVTLVTQEDLATYNADNLTESLRRLGNVRWNYGNPRTGSFSLRGLTAGASSDKIDPSVGLTVDGVSYAYLALAAGSNIFDTETLDVSRGPQGTQGAKSAAVGQINVKVKQPSFTPEASAALTLGDYNAVKTQGVAGGALIDDLLAWRISFSRDQQDGAFANQYPDLRGRESFVNTDRTYGRLQFLLTPTDDLRIRLLVDHQPKGGEALNGLSFRKDTPDFYANGGTVNKTNTATAKLGRRWFTQQSAYTAADYYNYPAYLDNNGSIITGTKGGLLDVSWSRGNHTLSSLSSWRDHYFSAGNDDGTPFDISYNGGFITTYWQFSQEFKLSSVGNDLVDYDTGLYFLKTKTDSFSRTRYGSDAGAYNASVAQYNTLDANAAGRLLAKDSLERLYRATQSYLDSTSKAAYANLQWHLSEPLTLTTGARVTREERNTREATLVYDNGYGAVLNPVSVANVALGGFDSYASTITDSNGVVHLAGSLGANNVAQLQLADQLANRYFGVAVTGTPGQAYNSLTSAQWAQVAAAKAIRLSSIGNLYAEADAEPYRGTLVTGQVSLANAFTDNHTGYVTWQHGAKAGISQFNGIANNAARSYPAKAESSNSYEIGIRSSFFNKALAINADVFYDDIRNFQQTLYTYDDYQTQLARAADSTANAVYTSGVGNVGKVVTQGLELDATYNGIKNLSLRFAGAYTSAKYKSSVLLALPSERANQSPAYFDANGLTLPNAPKVQFSITPEYRLPVFGNKVFHTGVSYSYSGRENTDSSLSAYGWKDAAGIADVSLGFGRQDDAFDVNVVVKNALNEKWGDIGWSSYTINTAPRWVGVTFRSKFY